MQDVQSTDETGSRTGTDRQASEAAAPGSEPAPAVRQGGRGNTPVALAILLAAAAVCGTVLYADELRSSLLSPSSTQLKLDALDRTVAGLTAMPEKIAALDQALAATGKRIDQQAVSGRAVSVIAARLLKDQLGTSDPFADDLALLRLSAGVDAELSKALDPVAGYAAKGVPSRTQLFASFGLLVPSILHAEAQDGQGGLSETVWGWMTGLSSIVLASASSDPAPEAAAAAQPVPPPAESRTPALLATTAARLEAGELAAAIDAMASLDGAAAPAAASWLADARARLAAERAGALLEDRIRGWTAAGKS
ncbi:mitofilin family membrane protein [Azospirillum sp. B510]|uniref:mitofilin family membrane protein n=1 Tax=Azospirillum sp. (strain B510) TaxID=137722 RepID=UPI0002FC93BD|nr:mitofilin family membrane protein [Azospirillum sp. B510]